MAEAPAGRVSIPVRAAIEAAIAPAADQVDEPFTPDEVTELWARFRARRCDHCGGAHARSCPKVRRIEFHPNGQLAGVEFWPDGRWADDHVQWPEELPPETGDIL